MNYKRILNILFLVEMVVGASLMVVGYTQMSASLIILGASVFLAHLVECFLLVKTQ